MNLGPVGRKWLHIPVAAVWAGAKDTHLALSGSAEPSTASLRPMRTWPSVFSETEAFAART